MSSDKDEKYWLGVRDALRMVDSFLKWSRRNPEQAKSLDDFISDGLIAAAKRCEKCLSEKLGVGFKDGSKFDEKETSDELFDSDPESSEYSTSPPSRESPIEPTHGSSYSEEDYEAEEFEIPTESREPIESEVSVESETDDIEPVSVESLGRSEQSETDDYAFSTPRHFEEDFELVEPSPLGVESLRSESELPPIPSTKEEIDDTMSEDIPSARFERSPVPESRTPSPEISERSVSSETESPSRPSEGPEFTWREYEETIAPSETEESIESSESEDEELEDEELESKSTRVWSPYDEPSMPDEKTEESDEDETEEETKSEEKASPPPPPPPPDDQSDEERKRRAKRLFFGA
ncbi:MAG: hypothetical protein GF411_09570 [Candidatus Lokiarchaeota archaeon]|nr:hypothetical protein [Candidatus Lokiarchaeota archaeon]